MVSKGCPENSRLGRSFPAFNKNEPIYKIGDNVITLKHNPNKDVKGGHTRLPSYAMGKMGKVYSYNGSHVLPDTNAHGNGEMPTPLYTVEFKALELWGASAENEMTWFTLIYGNHISL